MRSYAIFLCLVLCSLRCVSGFTIPQTVISSTTGNNSLKSTMYMAPKDPSRSGTKTERMERLAEMERMGTSTSGDNSVFIQAAGAFAALIVVAIAAAASSGLLTQY